MQLGNFFGRYIFSSQAVKVAQFVYNTEDELYSAMLNAKVFSFDNIMNQHHIFCDHIDILDNFLNRLQSGLSIGRSIDIQTDDIIERFIVEHGENIFFRGFIKEMARYYDEQRVKLQKPNDYVLATIKKSKEQQKISKELAEYFSENLSLISSKAFFDYTVPLEYRNIRNTRVIFLSDSFSFIIFHESENFLFDMLMELGEIVHRNKWKACKCGFCGNYFLDTEDKSCCHSDNCIKEKEKQKKKISPEHTKEYSEIKKNYDSYVRRYAGELRNAGIKMYYPIEYDSFIEEKERRQKDMENLKRHLIRNELPPTVLIERSEQYKSEIKALANEILDRYRRY